MTPEEQESLKQINDLPPIVVRFFQKVTIKLNQHNKDIEELMEVCLDQESRIEKLEKKIETIVQSN